MTDNYYGLLLQSLKDYAILLFDKNSSIIFANEGTASIKGYTPGELIGKPFALFYMPEDRKKGQPEKEIRMAARCGVLEKEGWRLRKNGTKFWANVVITPVYENGSLIGFSAVIRDMTEKKAAEDALKKSEERYRQLADKLNHANAELEQVNQGLEHFTSIVSHDLQEPLRTIHSFLQLIEMRLQGTGEPDPHTGESQTGPAVVGSPDELKTYISKAIRRSNQMKNLIVNLLQYSQLAGGKIESSELDVSELLDEVMQNLKNRIEDTSALITVNSKTEIIKGDRTQLIQLLQNLISNGIKFRGNRTPEITIDIGTEKDHYLFSVSDNGIGIPRDQLKNVFEIFRRMHNQKQYPGTGIGLFICKKIVERHAGRIWVESWPGKGTTFYFTISKHL